MFLCKRKEKVGRVVVLSYFGPIKIIVYKYSVFTLSVL